jgi:hypothetical protein
VHVRGDVPISSTSNKARYYIGHPEDVLSHIDDLSLKSLKVDVTYMPLQLCYFHQLKVSFHRQIA